MVRATPVAHRLGAHNGLTTLEQLFRFEGAGATASAVAELLLTAPLTGPDSIFGERPGVAGASEGEGRTLKGFSPAPAFRFDVTLTPHNDHRFLVHFSQPDRKTPYLEGDVVWSLDSVDDAVELDEQINTRRALEVVNQPLDGPKPSLRRWLFFRLGHRQVMASATRNIAALLNDRNE